VTFERFQNYARLYVVGALDSEEMEKFELARERHGPAAQEFVDECNCRHESLELSLKPAAKMQAIKTRLLSMVSRRHLTLLEA
jgi:hypothetical protein